MIGSRLRLTVAGALLSLLLVGEAEAAKRKYDFIPEEQLAAQSNVRVPTGEIEVDIVLRGKDGAELTLPPAAQGGFDAAMTAQLVELLGMQKAIEKFTQAAAAAQARPVKDRDAAMNTALETLRGKWGLLSSGTKSGLIFTKTLSEQVQKAAQEAFNEAKKSLDKRADAAVLAASVATTVSSMDGTTIELVKTADYGGGAAPATPEVKRSVAPAQAFVRRPFNLRLFLREYPNLAGEELAGFGIDLFFPANVSGQSNELLGAKVYEAFGRTQAALAADAAVADKAVAAATTDPARQAAIDAFTAKVEAARVALEAELQSAVDTFVVGLETRASNYKTAVIITSLSTTFKVAKNAGMLAVRWADPTAYIGLVSDIISIAADIKRFYGDAEVEQPKLAAQMEQLRATLESGAVDAPATKPKLDMWITNTKPVVTNYQLAVTRLEGKVDELHAKLMTAIYGISNGTPGPATAKLQAGFQSMLDGLLPMYEQVARHTSYSDAVDNTVLRVREVTGRSGAGKLFAIKDYFNDQVNTRFVAIKEKLLKRSFDASDAVDITAGLVGLAAGITGLAGDGTADVAAGILKQVASSMRTVRDGAVGVYGLATNGKAPSAADKSRYEASLKALDALLAP